MRIIPKWSFQVTHEFTGDLEDILKRRYILWRNELEKVAEFSEVELQELKEFFPTYQSPEQLRLTKPKFFVSKVRGKKAKVQRYD